MSTWVLNCVLQCLKMIKDDQNMLHALLDLINLLWWKVKYKFDGSHPDVSRNY